MAAINDLISQIDNSELRARIQAELERINKHRKFGLIFEEHLPESVWLYDLPIKKDSTVIRKEDGKSIYKVVSINEGIADCIDLITQEKTSLPVSDIVSIALFGTPIYPYLKPLDSICNSPNSDLWHILIEADNYHALQLLEYLYAGKVDCIYIDPPYNTGARDWKYNNNYVDSNDAYRHSKWLSFMQKRLVIAKKLLNPTDSVLIVTIDEKEYNHLACLLEQVFPEANIQMISSVINPSGTARVNEFRRSNEFIFFVMFGNYRICPTDENKSVRSGSPVPWRGFIRSSAKNIRTSRPGQFYPIYVNNATGCIECIGDPLDYTIDIHTLEGIPGCTSVFPIRENGTEMLWSWRPEVAREMLRKGFLKVAKYQPSHKMPFLIQYLTKGVIKDILKGNAIIEGYNKDGSVVAHYAESRKIYPTTQWNNPLHDARKYGNELLKGIIGERFDFPKSVFAVKDCLDLFVRNKSNALILDFFSGSGTTLHAVNLLNKEDGGCRRCIMVTNNEVSEEESKKLQNQGYQPGDEEWERLGIARFVNWPRTKCSILGLDINGKPLRGNYPTSQTKIVEKNRTFVQVDFMPENPTPHQKKALCSLIRAGKDVSIPPLNENDPFLLSDDDKFNTAIIFNESHRDDFLDSLEGCENIERFYIVTQNNSFFRELKAEITELLGKIEKQELVSAPMNDGFKTNACYFKLGFLNKNSIALGRQFRELIPVLWMKAGAIGPCPTLESDDLPDWLILPENKMAILIDDNKYRHFKEQMAQVDGIETLFIITDFEREYVIMAEELGIKNTFQLYRNYLDNFRINHNR